MNKTSFSRFLAIFVMLSLVIQPVVIYADSALDTLSLALTIRHVLDTDEDGLPNDWEELYGFNPFDPADGLVYRIDFSSDTILSYGGPVEDVDSTQYESLDSGKTLHMWGNNWKAIDVGSLPLYTNSAFKYWFRSDGAEGEIQCAGIDTDLTHSPSLWFQNAGTEVSGIQGFHDYYGTNWQLYAIQIGEFYTGQGEYFTFGNDADAGQLTSVYFKEVKLGMDSDADGLLNYEEFVNKTDPLDEDSDDDDLSDGLEIDVYHTDPANPDTDYDGWLDGYEVLVGTDPNDFLSNPNVGDRDQDGMTDQWEIDNGFDPDNPIDGSLYSINFSTDTILSYGGPLEDVDSTQYESLEGGDVLHMWGNNWKAVYKHINIYSNTTLKYGFRSVGAEGEINSVGADNDLIHSSFLWFQNSGTEISGNQDYNDYAW